MNSSINPSLALIVRSDCSIADCVRMMRDHEVGSILVINHKGQADLTGIFTERDLLNKIDLIQTGKQWEMPISSVMTHPVRTLDISKLEQAAESMLKFNIRHLPITVMDSSNQRQIVTGVISMRDLFKMMVKNLVDPVSFFKPVDLSPQNRRKIGIYSKDEFFPVFFKKIIKDFFPTEVEEIDFQNETALSYPILIVDIDHVDSAVWTDFLKKKNHDKLLDSVIIVFDPTLQSPEVTAILEKVGQSKKFCIFKKPVDVLKLFERLKTIKFET